MYRQYKVYKIRTNFTPTVKSDKNGKVKWGVILDSQSMDTKKMKLNDNKTSKTF